MEPTFQRSYHSLYRAIDGWPKIGEEERLEAVADALLKPDKQLYWLLVTDTTSYPRQFARTLKDRGFVHAANAGRGNKPVTIGHQYSVTASLPARNSEEPPWVVPLVSQRVRTQETESQVGLQQLVRLVEDEDLPWHNEFVMHVGDSRYSTPAFLYGAAQQENLVTSRGCAATVSCVAYRRLWRKKPGLDTPPPGTGRSLSSMIPQPGTNQMSG